MAASSIFAHVNKPSAPIIPTLTDLNEIRKLGDWEGMEKKD